MVDACQLGGRTRWSTVGQFCGQFIISLLVALAVAGLCYSQTDSATVSGVITDRSGAVVVGAEVVVTNTDTNVNWTSISNGSGIYFVTGLKPGRYRVHIGKEGFKGIDLIDLILDVQDSVSRNFTLQVGSTSESVSVDGNALQINTQDASVSTVVDRKYVENMPLNGRSFQDLILLTPGVVTISPQAQSSAGFNGEFSVNGQRTESNNYTVDGVSGNVGIFPGAPNSPSNSGSLSAATVLGTTQGLVSVDALEEFRVQSSSYSAEYGRNPGGQFSFATRSGTNNWHGTAFDYLRNDVFDANSWFNNYNGLRLPSLRQNDFGGTLGGPIMVPRLYNGKDKFFFFFSYEGLRLVQPQEASTSYVPTIQFRKSAPSALQPVLNAFPVSNCTSSQPSCISDLGNGLGDFVGTWSNPSQLDNYNARLDYAVNQRLRLFFRFNDTNSNTSARSGGNFADPAILSGFELTTRTYTFGVTSLFSAHLSNDFRMNYSSNEAAAGGHLDNFGGAQAANLFQLQGLGVNSNAYVTVSLVFGNFGSFATQSLLSGQQRQWNFVDTVSLSHGLHQTKLGIDFRRLAPVQRPNDPLIGFEYDSANSVQTNSADSLFIQSNAPAYPIYLNFSAFAEDEWHVSPRLSLSMGLRWDVNPAPGARRGNLPYTTEGKSLSTLTLAPQGTALWKTDWYGFAPRLGAALILRDSPGWETVARGGGGVFFDTGQQLGSYGYLGPGFSALNNFGTSAGVPASFPAPLAQVVPAIVNPPAPPYTNSTPFVFPAHMQLPYTWQWNVAIEQALGKSQALTVSYVGASGRKLLGFNQFQLSGGPPFLPTINPNFATVFLIRDGLTSDYHALQVQFQRRFSSGLQALASYTWAHSIDFGSNNSSLPYIRGNSDFDVRHSFSSAFSYDLPDIFRNRFASAVFHHWGIDDRFTARTGFPVTLNGSENFDQATGQFFFGTLDTVPGQPLYIYGQQCASLYNNGLGCPGGRAINPGAFANPPTDPNTLQNTRPGNAPRNFVRGFGAWQMDLAVRREFPVYERFKLQFRAEAFNIFNHPNFGAINAIYCNPSNGPGCTFGQANKSLADSLGTLSSIYQMGGSRSMQFALKLMF